MDPAYVSRVRGESGPLVPPKHGPRKFSGGSSAEGDAAQRHDSFGILPTPSPDRSPGLSHSLYGLPSWEATGTVAAGTKRSHELSVDEFVSDMKKRRVAPSYDLRECMFKLGVSC